MGDASQNGKAAALIVKRKRCLSPIGGRSRKNFGFHKLIPKKVFSVTKYSELQNLFLYTPLMTSNIFHTTVSLVASYIFVLLI